MQSPAATAANAAAAAAAAGTPPPNTYVVRPAGVLADLLGGSAELGQDELLLKLRELGLPFAAAWGATRDASRGAVRGDSVAVGPHGRVSGGGARGGAHVKHGLNTPGFSA